MADARDRLSCVDPPPVLAAVAAGTSVAFIWIVKWTLHRTPDPRGKALGP